jgi:hypothetical protein
MNKKLTYTIETLKIVPAPDAEVSEFVPRLRFQFQSSPDIVITKFEHADLLEVINIKSDGRSLILSGCLTLNKHQSGDIIQTLNLAFVFIPMATGEPFILGDCLHINEDYSEYIPFLFESIRTNEQLTAYVNEITQLKDVLFDI